MLSGAVGVPKSRGRRFVAAVLELSSAEPVHKGGDGAPPSSTPQKTIRKIIHPASRADSKTSEVI
jgi:hypothetical protein